METSFSDIAPIPIVVLRRDEAERHVPAPVDICISIVDPGGVPADLKGGFVAVLGLAFDDIEAERGHDDTPFDSGHAEAILGFLAVHRHAGRLIVHCQAGRSRSAGAALGICDALGWPTREIEASHPGWNRRVREILRRQARCRGRQGDNWVTRLFSRHRDRVTPGA